MSYYGQQQQQQQPGSSSSSSSNLFGDMHSSEGRKLYTELTGVDMNTFSNNATFSVPRFLQDNFDPAILHSADNTTAAYSPSQSASASSSNQQQHAFRDLDMQYNQTNAAYDNSYGNTTVTSSGPYSNLRFPTAPMFPPIPMPPPSYPNPMDMMDSSVPSNTAAVQQKPPRSSALLLNGLPIYSASGFDMLDILARVATRPQPKIAIGPVDMSCAFLVVDITRDDSPIIYASQTFTELTGYSEQETLGRNCRFLQAPPGVQLEKGGAREHTDIDSVTQMALNVSANRECQVTLVNYRKTGEAFINCVSIIPVIPSGSEPVRYHVGFQVDLAIQPLAIMKSVQSGTYVMNYSSTPLPPVVIHQNKLSVRGLSKDMADIIGKIGGPGSSGGAANESADRHRLSLALLEECPDAVFVVSLKGSFLYVSPSIIRVLDYDADYFLNKNLADICHPSDLAPTMRNIKESTATAAAAGTSNPAALTPAPTTSNDIELLFRARRSNGTYVWLDCPGKLHADTSRGRKALLLRLRKVDIPRITWGTINSAGGVYKDDIYLRVAKDDRALIVACSKSVEEVLGRKREEVVGKTLIEMIVDDSEGTKVDAIRAALGGGGLGGVDTICASTNTETTPTKVVYCNLPALVNSKRGKKIKSRTAGGPQDAGATANGKVVVLASAELTFFPALDSPDGDEDSASAWRSKLCTVIVRVRIVQRHPMRNDLRDGTVGPVSGYLSTSAKGAYGAPPTSASSAFPSTSGHGIPGYGLSNEMSLTSLTQPINTPLQLFQHTDPSGSTGLNMRKEGYQVPLTGNANAIDDSVPGDVIPPSNDGSGPSSAVGDGGSIGNGSSWLYDLEQLKKRNQALRAELAEVQEEQKSKRRARRGASFHAGHSLGAHHPQSSGTQGHNINMARLDALASASTSGLAAMNARRATAAQGTASSTWAMSFPGGDGGGNVNPPGLNLTMPPPPLPRQMGGGEDGHKRTWSQTDMHSEWPH